MCPFQPKWDPASSTSPKWQHIPKKDPCEQPGRPLGCLWAGDLHRDGKSHSLKAMGMGLEEQGPSQAWLSWKMFAANAFALSSLYLEYGEG